MSIKVLFFTLGREEVASSRVRVYGYLKYLEKAGFENRVIPYTSARYYRAFVKNKDNYFIRFFNKVYGWTNILRLIFEAGRYDIVFIQRVLVSQFVFKLIQKANKNIIFDFDDAIYLVDRYVRSKKEKGIFLERLRHVIKESRCVITTQSDSNVSFAKAINKNVVSLTTPVDIKRYYPSRDKNGKYIVIGWIGSPAATFYLYTIKEVFAILSKKYENLRIELIGAERFKIDGVHLIFKDWDLDKEVADLQGFDIGIMPLEYNNWSQNKYYKLLQYFAGGIPAVASDFGMCKELIRDGFNGFLAKDRKEWVDKLSALIEDKRLREDMGMRGRETAERSYSYETVSPILIETLRKLN